MASDGTNGPKPYTQRRASTVFLRVPYADWPAVSRGKKREFRGSRGNTSGLHFVNPPTPVVAYTVRQGQYQAKLMVLEKRWSEQLGAISDESLAAEGFKSLAEFRRYWMMRERRRFMPTREVVAYRVSPFEPGDIDIFGRRIMRHLYGEFLPYGDNL